MTHTEQCNRCDAPLGEIVILDNREPVCGACITQIASRADVGHRIAVDRTPASECGYLSGIKKKMAT